jgi:fumarate reductase subunit D
MKNEEKKKDVVNNGILFCSGMIAGEGLVGILLALLAVFGVADKLDLSAKLGLPVVASNIGSLVVFGLVILSLLKFTLWKKDKKSAQ